MTNEMMRSIEISQPGSADVLRLVERKRPTPGNNDIVVELYGVGINRPDILQREGKYNPPPGASDLPGLEGAGIISAIGKDVTKHKIGDHVCALFPGGSYAQFAATHEDHALPIPDDMDIVTAGGLCETHFTVWSNLFMRAGLKKGESVLIHGGTSGIGTTAIMLAKAFGVEVFTTAGSAEKCARCIDLGADVAINYREDDFVSVIERKTEKRGVDVVLDMVGGDYMPRNISCLGLDGRLVQIAFLSGSTNLTVNMAQVMMRRLTLTGSTLRPQSIGAKGAIADELRRHVWPLLSQGQCLPIVDSVFPFSKVGDAHRRMETSKHIGKIILDVKN